MASAGGAVTTDGSRSPLLALDGITAGYGRVAVLRDVSLTVENGSILALLGPNGAGKTTLLRAVAGLIPLTGGSIVFDGIDVTRVAPHERTRLGICYVPEGKGVFRNLTVRENLRIATPLWEKAPDISGLLERFPALKRRLNSRAGVMSGGEQQMLALARCYLSKPRIILADELSMGLAPKLVDSTLSSLKELAADGTTVVLVEQYVVRALELADTVYLLDRGVVGFGGARSELDAEMLHKHYLGA